MEEMRNAHKYLVRRTEGKRPLGRSSRRWKYIIRNDLRDKSLEGVNWIQLSQYRDQWQCCEHGNEPWSSI